MSDQFKNPTPIRLRDLKQPLQEEAMRIDRSLHWLVLKILRAYVSELKKDKPQT